MKIVGDIPHPHCRISLFEWNNRFLVKIEQGELEQTFKIDQYSVDGPEALKKLITREFIDETLDRFNGMRLSLQRTLNTL